MTHKTAVSFLTIQTFVVSLGYILTKAIGFEMDPFSILFFRAYITGLVSFLLIQILYKTEASEINESKALWKLSFLAVPLNQSCFLIGIHYTSTGEAAVIYALVPVITYLISLFRKEEFFEFKRMSGVLIAFIGVLIILLSTHTAFSAGHLWGNLTILAGAVTWAFYTVESRRFSIRYNPFVFSLKMLTHGAVWSFPLIIWVVFNGIPLSTKPEVWGVIGYLAIFGTIVSYALWVTGLKVLEPSRVAIFTNGQPIMTTILSYFILSQAITLPFLAGGVLVISGVLITQYAGLWKFTKTKIN